MRRIKRKALPKSAAKKLRKEQENANAKLSAKALNIEKEWKRARQNKPLKTAFSTLKVMAGKRERCMYCGDSQGTDIEHFWPKGAYPKKMFRWSNLLLGCTDCGRNHKGTKFPLDAGKQPLLLNPIDDDPWMFLDFDPQTGNLSSRFDATGTPIPKGIETVNVLALDRRESLAAGYKKTFERIREKIAPVLGMPAPDAPTLIKQLAEADDHGLLGWCFRGTGNSVKPLSDLRTIHPTIWMACSQAFLNH